MMPCCRPVSVRAKTGSPAFATALTTRAGEVFAGWSTLAALSSAKLDELGKRARAAGASFLVIGEAGGRDISFVGASGDRERVSLDDLRAAHESWLPAYMKVAH